MKKLLIIPVLIILMTTYAYADEDYEGNYIFESTGDGTYARITGFVGIKTELHIPSAVRGIPIIAIGDKVFSGRQLTSVIIPVNVILIGSEAFSKNEITMITIGANVTMSNNSFDSGFSGFYSNNEKRAGTYILNNGTWTMQLTTGTEQTPEEDSSTAKKAFFNIEPYGNFSTSIGLWDYGPSTLVPRPNLYFGILLQINNLKLYVSAGGGGFFGVTYPGFNDFGVMYGYFFGSLIEIFISDDFGMSFSGGMTQFYFNTKNNSAEDSFFPFVELNLMFGGQKSSFGICLRYYFNEEKHFYNKFSIGLKIGDLLKT